jgi:hypothetical protein
MMNQVYHLLKILRLDHTEFFENTALMNREQFVRFDDGEFRQYANVKGGRFRVAAKMCLKNDCL